MSRGPITKSQMIRLALICCVPWEIGIGIMCATSGHTYWAAGLLVAAVIGIMEMGNKGDNRA